jgi:flavorubredoxin
MAKALIVCVTRTGETTQIGNLIAEGLRMSGADTQVKDVKEIKSEADLKGYDALVLGSATYHGDMMQGMKTLLFMAEKAELKGKVGAAFGAFGWSGEAPDRIFGTMENIFQMKMVSGPLRLKSSSLGGGIKMAQDYGKEIAQAIENMA